MGKPDALTRRVGDEKARSEEWVFALGQLIQLSGDVNVAEDVVQDVEIEGIDCVN